MASDITILVTDPTRALSIRAGLSLSGRVKCFTPGSLFAAQENIQMHHPRLVAVEAEFAQTPAGQEFLERIERLSIKGSAIQLVVRGGQGKWATTPYAAQLATAESSAGVIGPDTERAVNVVPRPLVGAAPKKGANTRRADRFKILESLDAVVENGQASLVNVSILGAQVVSQPPLNPTQKVKIMLPDENDTLRLTAHVAWATFEQVKPGAAPHYRAGMEFTDAAKEILEDYCRRHCSQDPLPSY